MLLLALRLMLLFPAYAGVILSLTLMCAPVAPFPRQRGGDPLEKKTPAEIQNFSPPMRG